MVVLSLRSEIRGRQLAAGYDSLVKRRQRLFDGVQAGGTCGRFGASEGKVVL